MNYAVIRNVLDARMRLGASEVAESHEQRSEADAGEQTALEQAAIERYEQKGVQKVQAVVSAVISTVSAYAGAVGLDHDIKAADTVSGFIDSAGGWFGVAMSPDGAANDSSLASEEAKLEASVARAQTRDVQATFDTSVDRLRDVLLRRFA